MSTPENTTAIEDASDDVSQQAQKLVENLQSITDVAADLPSPKTSTTPLSETSSSKVPTTVTPAAVKATSVTYNPNSENYAHGLRLYFTCKN